MKSPMRLEVISDAIYLVEADARAFEAEFNRAKGQPSGVIHSDVSYASELFFLYCRDNAPILNQGSRRVAFLSGNSEDVHQYCSRNMGSVMRITCYPPAALPSREQNIINKRSTAELSSSNQSNRYIQHKYRNQRCQRSRARAGAIARSAVG